MQSRAIQAMIKFGRHYVKDSSPALGVEDFTDGNIFSRMLEKAEGFRMGFGDIEGSPPNWMRGLKNLKILIHKIESYFELKLSKGILVKDINLVQIAKNANQTELVKFFQVVVAVLTESPNKEEHIALIMGQSESDQRTFVELIQRILEKRILTHTQRHNDKIVEQLAYLEEENEHLYAQLKKAEENIELAHHQIFTLQTIMEEKEKHLGQLVDKYATSPEQAHSSLIAHYEQMKACNSGLRDKMVDQSRIHEMDLFKLKDEIEILQQKIQHLEDVEDMLLIYKEKYNEALIDLGGTKKLQKEKRKLETILAEKDIEIKRLNKKIEEMLAQSFVHQQKIIELDMELVRRESRLQEIQKELKKRINWTKEQNTNIFSSDHLDSEPLSAQLQKLNIKGIEGVRRIQRDLQRTSQRLKELQKQNFRLRRMSERFGKLEEQKKKLQRMIYSLTTERSEEFLILISSMSNLNRQAHELKEKNTAYYKILQANKLVE